ncbi:MAG: TolB family protein [Bacteroidota bacterium]
MNAQYKENGPFKIWAVPNVEQGAEFYFSPDGKSIIGNAKQGSDSIFQVYTVSIDGSVIRRINDKGEDACSFYFPDGKKLIFTSTKDNLDFPHGNFSDPSNYPQSPELYISDLEGKNVRRLTNNKYYDAEVSVSPDGKWVLFTRQIDGQLDLWKVRPDGTNETQLTKTKDIQEGGAFFLNEHTIIFRAWDIKDQGQKGIPMQIFTIKDDGTDLKKISNEPGTNWAPFPAPDGDHFSFVKVVPPKNFEIFIGSVSSPELKQITFSDAFDGYPAISPDGKLLTFSSNRDAKPGERKLMQYLVDISSLGLAAKKK